MKEWYVVMTNAAKERSVKSYLESIFPKDDIYLPMRYQKIQRKGRIKTPLFPQYLFVCINKEHIHTTNNVPGVKYIVGTTGEILPIDKLIITELKERETGGIIDLEKQWSGNVLVVDGLFKNIIGEVIERVKNKKNSPYDYMAILINLIGKKIRVNIPEHNLAEI
ncbi:MAG: hypothetical protein COU90_02795 [Candidatus Ryanbacteria bacterium CG10_big_fil_rev_8_21_14_0_10_43_42]|uniref:NusG-like N-terminal domain-containing protein n=1 Tax=Candidatus Ryanbacteria bacterium CG10_big_fil_rev_8_21_14_0_10_43_42 TaxID=1974864 RepID=A0A2M8KWP4_9BACT|nr:MAG: hypothetical protein COU90_02795 [Candidatus Ryanbacteria bacterium CG10_big_fil_rev_8_21_14_0_10_43_42]